jgi:hypothetical protein
MAYVHAHIESHHRTSFQASSLAVHGDARALHLVFISHYFQCEPGDGPATFWTELTILLRAFYSVEAGRGIVTRG